MYPRIFKFSEKQSFFLFGPRGSGKSTWLKANFKEAEYLDFLDEGLFQELLRDPGGFKLRINRLAPGSWVVVDEIQRLPGLLNYVHQAIEARKLKFVLTGSSARKLKRGEANLLAGRALDRRFNPLTAFELGADFDLRHSLEVGNLPAVVTAPDPRLFLRSYIGMYLREEVQQEALVRNLGAFVRFLETATFSQAQVLSVQSVARDIGVDRKTAEAYFELIEDLLIGHRIPVFQKRSKRKMTTHPKFYFTDVGIYQTLRPKGPLEENAGSLGVALESLVFQELKAWIDSLNLDLRIHFYRTLSKHEVDFVLYGDDGFFAFEVKAGSRLRVDDLDHIKEFAMDYPQARCFVLYGGNEDLRTDEGVEILSVKKALPRLGEILLGRETSRGARS